MRLEIMVDIDLLAISSSLSSLSLRIIALLVLANHNFKQ